MDPATLLNQKKRNANCPVKHTNPSIFDGVSLLQMVYVWSIDSGEFWDQWRKHQSYLIERVEPCRHAPALFRVRLPEVEGRDWNESSSLVRSSEGLSKLLLNSCPK